VYEGRFETRRESWARESRAGDGRYMDMDGISRTKECRCKIRVLDGLVLRVVAKKSRKGQPSACYLIF